MAAPHVAGIVAQLFQADPTATPAEVEAALRSRYSAHFVHNALTAIAAVDAQIRKQLEAEKKA